MSYSLFNRHENMDRETLSEIGSIIDLARFGTKGDNGAGSWELINQLYGLYDGYLYDELLINAQDLPKDLYRRIIKVWAVVSKYPTLYTSRIYNNVEEDETSDFTEDVDYKSLGVASGKLYLASLEN